jgi:hypothetical protein
MKLTHSMFESGSTILKWSINIIGFKLDEIKMIKKEYKNLRNKSFKNGLNNNMR